MSRGGADSRTEHNTLLTDFLDRRNDVVRDVSHPADELRSSQRRADGALIVCVGIELPGAAHDDDRGCHIVEIPEYVARALAIGIYELASYDKKLILAVVQVWFVREDVLVSTMKVVMFKKNDFAYLHTFFKLSIRKLRLGSAEPRRFRSVLAAVGGDVNLCRRASVGVGGKSGNMINGTARET